MTCWVSLQMISLLLFLTVQASSSSATSDNNSKAGGRCISLDKLNYRAGMKHWSELDTQSVSTNTRTCGETARQMHVNDRALSPWKYSLNQDKNRLPPKIAFAECLCQGCIINQHENMSYNSVLVRTQRLVQMRSQCPSNRHQYLVKWVVIKVPVACVCVVPK